MWGTMAVIRRVLPAIGENWRPLAVEFDFPAPTAVSAYVPKLGANITFGRPANRFSVGSEYLECRPPEANRSLFKLMTKLAEIERSRRGISESKFESDVRAQLALLLPEGKTRLSDLADALAMTPSQLRTGLARNRLSFKDLLETIRKEMAETRLLESSISVTEIAFSLGYTDCSIFTRACHKWFGKSPREMRAT